MNKVERKYVDEIGVERRSAFAQVKAAPKHEINLWWGIKVRSTG